MFEYYQTFPKQAKPLLSEVQLSDFQYPSVGQKNSEFFFVKIEKFVTVGTDIPTYTFYKYLTKMIDEKS